MLHLENLYQFIVPLTFLAIWALTSFFNREAPPLPQRTVRPPGPGLGPGSTTVRPDPLNREAGLRLASPTSPDRIAARRMGVRGDDEILIIEETRRPGGGGSQVAANPPGTRVSSTGVPRRGSRSRSAPAPASRRTELTAPRPLTGAVGSTTPIGQSIGRALELNPLAMPASPLHASDARDLARTVSEPTQQAARPALVWDDYRLLVSTPSKLREAVLVSEILQPPLALRRRQPGS